MKFMLTVLRNGIYYNVFFNGLLKYTIPIDRPHCSPEQCTFQISGNSVLFQWPGNGTPLPEQRLIIFNEQGTGTYDGIPYFG